MFCAFALFHHDRNISVRYEVISHEYLLFIRKYCIYNQQRDSYLTPIIRVEVMLHDPGSVPVPLVTPENGFAQPRSGIVKIGEHERTNRTASTGNMIDQHPVYRIIGGGDAGRGNHRHGTGPRIKVDKRDRSKGNSTPGTPILTI